MGFVIDPTAEASSATPRWALTLPQVWAVAAVLIPVAVLQQLLGSVDLTYQLRAGAWMTATHSVMRADLFSFTAFGRPWLDQQWLAQIVLSSAYHATGWGGLAALQGLLVGVASAFVYLAARAARAPARVAALLTVGSFVIGFD